MHKDSLYKKVQSLKHRSYFKNVYTDNNLGILTYGDYGTGKTTIMSIISNELERDILMVNFAEVQTKTIYNKIFNLDNEQKYVYALDELDLLLMELLNQTSINPNQSLLSSILSKSNRQLDAGEIKKAYTRK